MPVTTVDIPVELSPVAQIKLVLMAGIELRLRALNGGAARRGTWARVAQRLEMDESYLSRLRSRQHDRFSLEQLIRLATDIGVKITIRTE